MNGSWLRPSAARGRWRLLVAAAVVVSVALATAAATATASRDAGSQASATAQASANGKGHKGKPNKPRKLKLNKGKHGQEAPPAPGAREVDGEPPDDVGGGVATKNLPDLTGDSGVQTPALHAFSAAALNPLSQTGSFALLESLTGATFANTCVTSGGVCNGAEPPDTQMAAGRNEIVEDVNNNMFVYTKGGTLIASFPLTTIFQPPNQTVGLTDPKIVFDPTTNRYYATEMVCENAGCGANNWTHMGISLAISPDGLNWTIYDYLNDGQNLQDQEKLGFSGDKITFAVNEYNCKCGAGSQYLQENIVVVQKSDAVAGNSITPAIFNDSSNNSNSAYIFDSMPTTPVNGSTSDNTQYVVWDWQGSSNNFMKIVRITGTPNANNVDFTGNVTTISIANQTAPPTPVAKGGNLAGDKQNFQSATVSGNELWATATDGCTPQGDNATRDCTRLVEVTLNNNSVVTDTDVGTTGTYRINPSVSKDSDGNVFFGFTISDANTYATGALDASSLPLPQTLQRINLTSGDSGYGGGRWGDYSGTQQDPSDTHDVWTAQEFGNCTTGCPPGFSSGPLWATTLAQFTFHEPVITSISPTQGPTLGGTLVDIHGSEFANGGTTVRFGANASSTVTWLDSTHIQAVSPPGAAGTVHVTAETGAGTSNTSSADEFTYFKVPTTTTYTGPSNADYHDPVTLSAHLKNNLTQTGVQGKQIDFTVGAESCSGTTNGSGDASCTVTLADTPGSGYTVTASFAGDADYLSSSDSQPFTVNKEETTTTYTGPLVILAGAQGATLTGTLVEDGANDTDSDGGSAVPNPTETVTLSIGSQSCTASTTSSSGNVSCTIPSVTVTLGSQTVGASFAGDTYYKPSSQTKTAIVFAFPSSGVFALGDLTVSGATPTTTVNWWNSNWNLLNSLSGGAAPAAFKGFVSTTTLPTQTPANICSGNWTTSTGNSPPPPATVPSYMGVIVTPKVTKNGNTFSGSYAKIVVVKTDPGYAPGPQNAGTGKIVAVFCP